MVDIISLIQLNPIISIIIIGFVVSFLISLINYFIIDKEKVRGIKAKQKALQLQIKEHQKAGNNAKMMELYKEMMSHTMVMMKHSFKPMIITFIPIILLIGFIKGIYAETAIGGKWIWYYIGSAFVSSLIFRKVFNLP